VGHHYSEDYFSHPRSIFSERGGAENGCPLSPG
jgi:hypothetical protein